ncbi:hypothetical protein COJ85_13985 [Bacillus sp. AFS076308]|uniref:hypothetical protein n=1 Tax=Bacillus sp. AFS076308 TaxID=2033512 RepID=UPI000BF95E31|nr:hypothetical protein [Bacillus sp. AFS076308]PFO03748.1 hypothetical protein COJ85_13985 [Bacillus sp. AFS076308]
MSIELKLLVDKYIDKEDIEQIIFNLGFKKNEIRGNYLWHNSDYVSTRGCWFDFQFDVEVFISAEPELHKVYKTVLSTKTYSGRSFSDIEMQMEVLRKIQEKYGGDVFDPDELEFGFFENDLPNLSRTEIGCGLAYMHFTHNLYKAKLLIEDVDLEEIKGKLALGFPILNIELLRNNTLLPFFVSVLETFLKLFFMRYLETNDEAVNKIFSKKDKLPYSTVKDLISGEKTIIDIEMEEYSFQNFNSANRGYKNYLNFDLFKVLSNKIIYNENEETIASVLQEMINRRHEIIHEAKLEYHLDKSTMDKYYYFLEKFGEIFITEFMKKHKLRLLIDDEL